MRHGVPEMLTILCVDKCERLEERSTMIRKAGYCCLTASTADEAERSFVADSVDVVILFEGDPGIHGGALATHLKRIRRVKILMVTGTPPRTGFPMSVDNLLLIPQSPSALLDAVASIAQTVGTLELRV
jgi:DNA-binding response OmpR family regulator